MKHGTLKLVCLALAVVAFIAAPFTAKADTISLNLTSGVSNVTILDNGPGDANPAVGVITYVGAVGAWDINVSTGQTVGSPTYTLDLNSTDTASTGMASPLVITFTDSGMTTPFGGYLMTIGGTTQTSATYEVDLNGVYLNSLGPFSTPSFSGAIGGDTTAPSTYTLAQIVTVGGTTSPTASLTSFDSSIQVPEPASLSLLGTTLLAAAGLLRRKLMKN